MIIHVIYVLTLTQNIFGLPDPHHLTWRSPNLEDTPEDPEVLRNRPYHMFRGCPTAIITHLFSVPPRDFTVSKEFRGFELDDIDNTGVPACDENNAPDSYMVYCSGKLLQAVMATHLYPDSKSFVDKPIKENKTARAIAESFEKRFPQPIEEINPEDVKRFVDENFDKEGQELEECNLVDWIKNPPNITEIRDQTLRKFALDLHNVWTKLCRQVKTIVRDQPERFSLMYVPHPFIAPGGRFRENYYWDAYWIMKGLLVSGMQHTVRGMIHNFAHFIEKHGLIPNGGRVYYLGRSQPPMFIPMVYDYYEYTGDIEFVKEMMPFMEQEMEFWRRNRAVQVETSHGNVTVYQYRSPVTTPRPESYREDIISAYNVSKSEKHKFFQNIASAAESGWDFSTRWMADKKNLHTIETTNIVPSDLNAFLCYNMNLLAHLHAEIGNHDKVQKWKSEYIDFRNVFKQVFYVSKGRGWYDYNLVTKDHNLDFFPSIAIPLYTQCYDPLSTRLPEDVYNQMDSMGVFKFAGGIPTSLQPNSEQQWDYPNGWSPLNHMVIEGLRKSTNSRMQQKAYELAEKWVMSNLRVFQKDKMMWEKYDVVATKPRTGDGGEYEVQAGFGWTNGVVLDLLYKYRERMRYPDIHPPIIPVPQIFRNPAAIVHRGVENSSTSYRAFIVSLFVSLLLIF